MVYYINTSYNGIPTIKETDEYEDEEIVESIDEICCWTPTFIEDYVFKTKEFAIIVFRKFVEKNIEDIKEDIELYIKDKNEEIEIFKTALQAYNE